MAMDRPPNLSAEERRRALRSGLRISLFASAALGFGFGLALWVWVTGRWETLAVALGGAVSMALATFAIVAASARWLVRWFPTTSPPLLANGARGLVAYVMSVPVAWALPSVLGDDVMPRLVAQTYPYVGGVVILITVTSIGLYSRLQVEVTAHRKAAMEFEITLDKLRSVWHRLRRSLRSGGHER